MHLNPEEKAIGKHNYNVAMDEFSRRSFIKGTLATAAASGVGLGTFYYGYEKLHDPVRIGVIGTGDEGSVLIGAHNPNFTRIVAIADIRPYNVYRAFHGDESSAGALQARPGLLAKYGWSSESEARQHIKVYDKDYHDLLNDPDVEGVIIALPLHLHAKVAIEAMRAGKHVLTEKLMAHSIHECKEMARVAKETGKLLATGHQRHYSVLYDQAVETIKRGLIGDVHHIRAQWHRGPDSWKFDMPDEALAKKLADLQKKRVLESNLGDTSLAEELADLAKRRQVELKAVKPDAKRLRDLETQIRVCERKMLDKDVDAAAYGYIERQLKDESGKIVYTCSPLEELIRWRLWDRTGGGLMAELGSHQLDASSIFISAQWEKATKQKIKVQPLSVTAVGGRHIYPYDRDVDDHVYCMYEFPAPGYYKDYEKKEPGDPNKKIVVTYSSISGNGYGGYGEVVMGTKGTLILEAEQETMLFGDRGTTTNLKVSTNKDNTVTASPSEAPVAVAAGGGASEGPVSRGYTEEIEHWAWCIRNPSPENIPRCHPKVAMADAIIALTSNMAIKQQKRIEFKPEWFEIDSDETPEGVKPDLSRYTA
jgi:predicted dehydrogenase